MNTVITEYEIPINQDKKLVVLGFFFLVFAVVFSSLFIIGLGIIVIGAFSSTDIQWWEVALFSIPVLTGLFLHYRVFFLNGFLWFVYGKEKITFSPTELILERSRGFSYFSRNIISYNSITGIQLSDKIGFFTYTGKPFEHGTIRLQHHKEKYLNFGGRKATEDIHTIYNTILQKAEHIK